MKQRPDLPSLPIEEWEDTKMTLHLMLQIIGKTRLKMTPRKNHWWFITSYLSPLGFTTSNVPLGDGLNTFEVVLNVHNSQVEVVTSLNQKEEIPLKEGLSVADFYKKFIDVLNKSGIAPHIYDKPFDLGINKHFSEIDEYYHFDLEYVQRFWKIMLWVNGVFQEFGGRFYGKTCPSQLYWHHLDLAITRFSGRKAPPMDATARLSDKDAYSHENISFGFWAGDNVVREPAFYSYTYPSPEEIEKEPLRPSNASWVDNNGSPMAFYRYEDLLREENPREALLSFLESAYLAGARLAGWDIKAFTVPGLDEL